MDGNRSMTVHVPFLDFVIDSKSLRETVAGTAPGQSFVTNLCRAWTPDAVRHAIDELIGGANGQDRTEVEILTCAVCGDRGCGAVLADITSTDRTVTWNNWQHADATSAEALPELPALTFERTTFITVITSAAEAVARLPYDERANNPRGFLWPWQWGW